jgi:hypothetical protein
LRTVVLAGATAVVIAAMAFPLGRPAQGDAAVNDVPERWKAAADVPPSPRPIPPAASATPVASAVPDDAPRPGREPLKKTAPVETTRAGAAPRSPVPVARVAPMASAPVSEIAATKPAEPDPTPAVSAPAVASTEKPGLAPVTITGCLEMSVGEDEYRLTDTDGADAPKSRSWRTGFLRKRSAPVALVEPLDQQALHAQVGKRVAATGLLTSRDLRVSSLRVVGACN